MDWGLILFLWYAVISMRLKNIALFPFAKLFCF